VRLQPQLPVPAGYDEDFAVPGLWGCLL